MANDIYQSASASKKDINYTVKILIHSRKT